MKVARGRKWTLLSAEISFSDPSVEPPPPSDVPPAYIVVTDIDLADYADPPPLWVSGEARWLRPREQRP